MLEQDFQRCSLVFCQVNDVKTCPAMLAVRTGAAPQAVGPQGYFAYAFNHLFADQAALHQLVCGQRRVTEQHEAIGGQVDHAAQALPGV